MHEGSVRGRRTGDESGFSIVELLVAVAVIGILASIAIPAYLEKIEKAKVAKTVTDLKTFEKGFLAYNADKGEFPPDSHLDKPYHLKNGYETEKYLPVQIWVEQTPLGGNYNWEGPNYYPYAAISFYRPDAKPSVFLEVDTVIDDGNLKSGKFRFTKNGRFTYIIDE